MKFVYLTVFAVYWLIVSPVLAEDDECSKLLREGFYKTVTIKRTGDYRLDSKAYFSSDDFRKDFKEGKWSFGLDTVINGSPFKLDGSSSDQRREEFQQKVRSSSSFEVTNTTLEEISIRVPDDVFVAEYVKCIQALHNGYGIFVKPESNDDSIVFTVTVRKQSRETPDPVVEYFNVQNAISVDNSLAAGGVIKDYYMFTVKRDPKKDVIVSILTTLGPSVTTIHSDMLPPESADCPVGTIITSLLDFSDFSRLTHNNRYNLDGDRWTSARSLWAPADFREVPGSRYTTVTSRPRVPDLRGLFLRGLNQFDTTSKPRSDGYVDPEDSANTRSVGEPEKDMVGPHEHPIFKGSGDVVLDDNRWKGDSARFPSAIADFRAKARQLSTDENAGKETRPKNAAVYWYVRIN